jgi:hypothetical protein
MANGTFKTKVDIDCHSPRLMPNNCKNLNPPYFSLPSTFKERLNHRICAGAVVIVTRVSTKKVQQLVHWIKDLHQLHLPDRPTVSQQVFNCLCHQSQY